MTNKPLQCSRPCDAAEVETPVGPILIEAGREGVLSIQFKNSRALCDGVPCAADSHAQFRVRREMVNGENEHLDDAVKWIISYFSGEHATSKKPTLCLPRNESFTTICWKGALEKVHFGQRMSYGELAEACGKSTSHSRAVGTAMSKNPFILLVPCHRIVKSGGEIGNYSGGGSTVKKWLLDFEASVLKNEFN